MIKTVLVSLLLGATCALAQSAPVPATTPARAELQAKPEEVNSVEAILAATYDVISGPAGKKRDWDRFRSLFYPGARLIPTGKRPGETEVRARVLSADDYVDRSAALLEKEGLFDRGVSNKVDHYVNIAQ